MCMVAPALARGETELQPPITNSFALVDNRVFLKVFLNGKGPFAFILDTGAGDGSSISLGLYRHLKLPRDGEEDVTGADAATQRVAKTHVASVRFASIELGPLPLMAFSMQAMTQAIGFKGLDGILGDSLFDRYVVTLDFDRQQVTLTDPRQYQPPDGATIVPFTIYVHLVPMYEGTVDGLRGKFLIDLGDRSSFTLFRPFWEKNGFDRKHGPVLEAMTGIGIGGPIHGFVTRVGAVSLGETKIANPVTRLVVQKPSAIDDQVISGSVGTGILKRFVVSFDYSRGRMILTPGKRRNEPDSYDRAGLWIGRLGIGLKVLDVTTGGPAATAGIHPGDAIFSIDGTPAAKIDLPALRERFQNAELNYADIIVVREGRRVAKRVILRDLVSAAH
jgi:membrane-associated protease RseP (regulator of RpoE activity)